MNYDIFSNILAYIIFPAYMLFFFASIYEKFGLVLVFFPVGAISSTIGIVICLIDGPTPSFNYEYFNSFFLDLASRPFGNPAIMFISTSIFLFILQWQEYIVGLNKIFKIRR